VARNRLSVSDKCTKRKRPPFGAFLLSSCREVARPRCLGVLLGASLYSGNFNDLAARECAEKLSS